MRSGFEQFYSQYFAKIASFSQNFCNCSFHEAEELAQEIVIKILQNQEKYDQNYSLNTWIYTIARNHCLDWKRKQKRRVDSGSVEPWDFVSYHATPDKEMEETEIQKAVDHFLSALNEEDRAIAYLRFFEEMKYEQIAEIVEKPSGSIRFKIHKIRQDLAKYLEEHYAIQGYR